MRLIVLCLGGLAAFAGGALFWGYLAFTAPGPLPAATNLVIPRGAGLERIADRLAAAGILENRWIFTTAVGLLGNRRKLRAGEYRFPAHASARIAMEVLIFAKPVLRHLTVPEGLTTAQVVAEIDRADGLEGKITDRPAEGSLLPETYSFTYGDSREEMVARMRKAMEETLDTLWKERAPDLPLKSPREALILASIVEKETGLPAERPHVAAVFLNRLRRGMRLQSDPTVIYALTHGAGPLSRPLVHADFDTPSPYNSYLYEGLPPGPIANPGRASLLAVLHPDDSDDLYFVADGSGGHVFAKTLAEHNRNVARLRQLRPAVSPAKPAPPPPSPAGAAPPPAAPAPGSDAVKPVE